MTNQKTLPKSRREGTMNSEDIEKIQSLMAEHDITNVEYFVAWVKRLRDFAHGVKDYVEILDTNGDLD